MKMTQLKTTIFLLLLLFVIPSCTGNISTSCDCEVEKYAENIDMPLVESASGNKSEKFEIFKKLLNRVVNKQYSQICGKSINDVYISIYLVSLEMEDYFFIKIIYPLHQSNGYSIRLARKGTNNFISPKPKPDFVFGVASKGTVSQNYYFDNIDPNIPYIMKVGDKEFSFQCKK